MFSTLGRSRRLSVLSSAVASIATTILASSASAQIAYVTTEQAGAPIGVFYRDAGAWNYAGSLGAGTLGATYGIVRNGTEFLVSESTNNTGRIVRMGLDGTVTPLATPLDSTSLKGSSTAAPSIQGMTFGPDGKVYIATAFGTPAGNGIWRANADGSGLQQIIPASMIPGTNWNIRDLSIADVDGDASNGFDVYFGTRGGFGDLNRPYFHFNVNGSTVTNVETLTSLAGSPSTVLYDSTTNKVYLGRTSAATYQVASVNPTGAAQTPTVIFNQGDVSFDLVKIGNDVLSLSSTAAANLTLRYVTGGAPGTVYADFASLSGGVVATGRQLATIEASELTNVVWDGGGPNNNFTSAANYVSNIAPDYLTTGFAPRVTFAGTTRLAPTNDVVNGRVGSIAFDATAGAFTVGGNGFTIPIAGGVNNLSVNTQTFSTNSPITITGGSIGATNGSIVFNNDVVSATGGLLTLAGTFDITFNGKLSGAGNIDKSNIGALKLNNAANDYTGRLTINRGALVIDSAAAQTGLGAASSTLGVGGGLLDGVIKLSNNVGVEKSISLASRNAQPLPAAPNTFLPQIQSVGGANSVTTVNLTGGTGAAVVQADAGATLNLGTVANVTTGNAAATLLVQGNGNTNITSSIGGGTSNGLLSITKFGAGTLTVNGFGTGPNGVLNAGSMSIRQGTVALNAMIPSTTVRATTIQIDAGATLDATAIGSFDSQPGQVITGSGTLRAPNILFYEDNVVRPGDVSDSSRIGTLNLAGNTQIGNVFNSPTGGLYYDLRGTPSAAGDRIAVQGDLALNSSTGPIAINVFSVDGTYASGSYRLIDYTGSLSGAGSTLAANLTGGTANYRQSFAVDTSTSGQVNLIVSGSAKTLTWKGDGAGTDDKFDVNTTANFLDGATPEKFFQGDTVQFIDDPSADAIAVIQSPIIGKVNVNASQNYTIKNIADYDPVTTGAQPSGFAEGTIVTKSGTGTLTIDSTGGFFPWAGSLIVNNGVVAITGPSGGLGGLPFGLGVLGHAATVLDGGTLRFVNQTAATAAGSSGRTFTVGSNGGTIENVSVGDISLGTTNGVVQFVGDGNRTLTFGGSRNIAFGGVLNDPTVGALSLVKSGTNSLSLNGIANSYGGTTTVNRGRLNISNAASLGSAAGGTTVNSGGGVYALLGTGSFTIAEPFSIAGVGPDFGGAGGPEASGALRIGNLSQVTFTGPLTVAADANIGIDDSSASATFTNTISGPGGLTKVGGAGRLVIGNGTSGAINIGGALTINNGTAAINTNPANANKTGGLALAGTGSIDMVKSKLAVDYVAGNSPLAAIQSAVTGGFNGGTWNGVGINSSFTATNSAYGVGVVEASAALGGATTWFNAAVDADTVLVAVVLKGDTNLSGTVNFDDLLSLAQNYGGSGKSWIDGDSDYNQLVNFDDLLALAQNYGAAGLSDASALGGVGGESFAADWALALSVVPEPTSISVIAVAGLAFPKRRRTH